MTRAMRAERTMRPNEERKSSNQNGLRVVADYNEDMVNCTNYCVASMTGNVYELDALDAIRVLATSKVGPILTVPFHQGVQPFITFRVSENVAMKLMRGRKQLM